MSASLTGAAASCDSPARFFASPIGPVIPVMACRRGDTPNRSEKSPPGDADRQASPIAQTPLFFPSRRADRRSSLVGERAPVPPFSF